jgi:hypothetical protein
MMYRETHLRARLMLFLSASALSSSGQMRRPSANLTEGGKTPMDKVVTRLKRLDEAPARVRPLLDVINMISDDLEAHGARVSEIDAERMIAALTDSGGVASVSFVLLGQRFVLMVTRKAGS